MSASYALRVYGHEWAQRLLQAAVLDDHTSHAYLFTGPDQIGKTILARAFAQALTCQSPQPGQGLGACGQCRSCRLAADAGHPDHRIIMSEQGQIKIEAIRDVVREATVSPVEGRFKVFILLGFERANASAANALLKTLEEPSASTRLILTTNQTASLLPTITSRCQVINLRLLPAAAVESALGEGWQIAPERSTLLAGLSRGRLGWAVRMATEPGLWARREQRLEMTQTLVRQGVVERLAYAERLAESDDLDATLQDWLIWWRDVWLWQQGLQRQALHQDQAQELRDLSAATRTGDVRRFLNALLTTASYVRTTVSMRLALESLLLKMPSIS